MRFIDFDWAGRAGHVFYPPFMDHRDIVWPPDVQEFAPALQKHDRHLLNWQLTHRLHMRGPSAIMYKQPRMQGDPSISSKHLIDMPICVDVQKYFELRWTGICCKQYVK